MFLTEEEICALTGVRRRQRLVRYELQRQVLVQMGIPFLVRPDGSLVLLREAVLQLLGASPGDERAAPPPSLAGFDWSEAYRQERVRTQEKRNAKRAKIQAARDRRRAIQEANGLLKNGPSK